MWLRPQLNQYKPAARYIEVVWINYSGRLMLNNRAFHGLFNLLAFLVTYVAQPTWPPVARCEYLGWCHLPNSASKECAKNMRHRNSPHYWRNSIGCANNSQAYRIWVNTVSIHLDRVPETIWSFWLFGNNNENIF